MVPQSPAGQVIQSFLLPAVPEKQKPPHLKPRGGFQLAAVMIRNLAALAAKSTPLVFTAAALNHYDNRVCLRQPFYFFVPPTSPVVHSKQLTAVLVSVGPCHLREITIKMKPSLLRNRSTFRK
jgi:hypothetical protein